MSTPATDHDIRPMWCPTARPPHRDDTGVEWILHMLFEPGGTSLSRASACVGLTLSAVPPRPLDDWPSCYDVCITCAKAYVRRLTGEIIAARAERLRRAADAEA